MPSPPESRMVIEGFALIRIEQVSVPENKMFPEQWLTWATIKPGDTPLFLVECFLADDTPYCHIATDLEETWDVMHRIAGNYFIKNHNLGMSPARRKQVIDFIGEELKDI
jgi:hypothetical protein